MRRHLLWSAGVFLVTGVYAGCSDSGDQPAAGGQAGAGATGTGAEGGVAGAGAGSGASGAVSPAGGSTGSSGASGTTGASGNAGAGGGVFGAGGTGVRDAALPDVVFDYDARPEDTGLGDGCATVTARAEASPLDMYIILDNSGSMNEPQLNIGSLGDCNVGQNVDSKWCRAINALNGFFTQSSGMGVALQYFNISGDSCAPKTTPAVALQTLPAHTSALVTSLNAAGPNGGTPTISAAEGIVQYTSNPANQRPGRRLIGIIITDGDPQGCSNNNPTSVNTAIANHYSASGVPTFIIGMDGASFNNLETMARNASPRQHASYCAPGVQNCWYYSVGNGDPTAFVAALREIQQNAIGCAFNMPRTDAGVVDPRRISVTYTAGGMGTPQALPRQPDVGSCPTTGWYYDNPTAPNTINLCPDTCRLIKTDPAAKIDVIVGCQGA